VQEVRLQMMFKDVYGEDVAEPLAAAKLFAYVASGVGAGADSAPAPIITPERDKCQAEEEKDKTEEEKDGNMFSLLMTMKPPLSEHPYVRRVLSLGADRSSKRCPCT
jgi:ribosomal protein L12E/L44/L45/RPP1/RPP2